MSALDPQAEVLNSAIQAKMIEVGLAQSTDAAGFSEYILLMLKSGNSQEEVVQELCSEFLNLPPGDPTTTQFVAWIFEQAQLMSGGGDVPAPHAEQTSIAPESMDASTSEMDTAMGAGPGELNAPTGPRSMRNGNNPRGGRDKRMLNQIGKAMDRTGGDPLHRTRGNDRINSHNNRGPPGGPRGGRGGGRGGMNARAANIQAGINAMGPMNGPGGPGGMNGGAWMGPQPGNMDLLAMMQQQSEMMAQMQQQILSGGFGNQRGGHGKSLFERSQNPRHNNKNRHQNNNNRTEAGEGGAEGEDVDMTKREPASPEDTVCKYNLRCTNRECKFAHQSPAAPPNTNVEVHDVCTFGAACKNRKCTGRHPSPAAKLAHQGEQDCKFFPNCFNPQCPFKHPDMPLCRNGARCTTENCKFTHIQTKCRFNPCKNPRCPYTHEEGQQGVFKDKVWTAEGEEHVSERKFVQNEDGTETEEVILPQNDVSMDQEGGAPQELIT